MVRYADDFVILCRSQAEAQAARREVQAWVAREGLTLHPEKTRIVEATPRGGFEFLGWHYPDFRNSTIVFGKTPDFWGIALESLHYSRGLGGAPPQSSNWPLTVILGGGCSGSCQPSCAKSIW
jgi:hypothetical protein